LRIVDRVICLTTTIKINIYETGFEPIIIAVHEIIYKIRNEPYLTFLNVRQL
jgi:hypothetical protein